MQNARDKKSGRELIAASLDAPETVCKGGRDLRILRWIGLFVGLAVVWRVVWWFNPTFKKRLARLSPDLTERNRDFYELIWSNTDLVDPERFNTWPLVRELISPETKTLEIGPGLRPRLPAHGTVFVDLSPVAVERLKLAGADARIGVLTDLPLDEEFDLVAALDVLEHVEDDVRALSELGRVLVAGGILLVSVPLFPAAWTDFDEFVGHSRRYELDELVGKLGSAGFQIERSAGYGMAPRTPWVLNLATRFLTSRPCESAKQYARWLGPLGMWCQRPLVFAEGLVVGERVDEVILVCRRQPGR
ncbi:MAG: class I SAM-dependent methyltransferase [Chthoniobacterales bacterium]